MEEQEQKNKECFRYGNFEEHYDKTRRYEEAKLLSTAP